MVNAKCVLGIGHGFLKTAGEGVQHKCQGHVLGEGFYGRFSPACINDLVTIITGSHAGLLLVCCSMLLHLLITSYTA